MSNWTTSKLSDVIEIIGGGTPKRSENKYWNGDIPWLSVADFNNDFRYVNDSIEHITELGLQKSSTKLLDKDHLIISARGTVGCLAQLSVPMAFNQSCYGLNGKEGIIDNGFLYYFLKNNISELKQKTHGAVFDTITRDTFEHIQISYPDLGTQKGIAKNLGSFDDKIQLNTQINQTLEQIAQALFKSWFVDFDPVRAKVQALSDGLSLEQAEQAAMQAISGKTPEELTALSQTQPDRYTELAETAKAFPCEMVEVDGVEVSKGWEIKPFGSLLENTIGGDWGKEEEDEKHTENVFVFRGTDLPNVQTNEFDAIPKRYIAKNKLKSRKAKYGDIIIEVSGGSKNQPTGRSLLITKNLLCNFDLPIIPASFCRLFTPINEKIAVFLACHLKMIYTQGKTWEYQVQSTGISNFQTKNFLENELVVIPDENIFNAFYEKVGVIFEKMASNENMLLSKTRDLLLPRLLNGEI